MHPFSRKSKIAFKRLLCFLVVLPSYGTVRFQYFREKFHRQYYLCIYTSMQLAARLANVTRSISLVKMHAHCEFLISIQPK